MTISFPEEIEQGIAVFSRKNPLKHNSGSSDRPDRLQRGWSSITPISYRIVRRLCNDTIINHRQRQRLYRGKRKCYRKHMTFRAIKEKYRVVCILGIWCPDSRDGVPAFLKALNLANLTTVEIELLGVDRKKEDPLESAGKFGVERVPTFIIYSGGEEIGRMIEFPETTFESDFLRIISSNN